MGDEHYTALKAAQDSVYWTGAAAVAAWLFGMLGLVLNVVAAIFIWRQVRANEVALSLAESNAKSAAGAVDLASLDLRPWVIVELLEVRNQGEFGREWAVFVRYRLTNIGKTPALECELHSEAFPADLRPIKTSILPVYNDIVASGSRHSRTIFPNQPLEQFGLLHRPKQNDLGPDPFYLLLVATYRAAGSSEWKATPVVGVVTAQSVRPSRGQEKVELTLGVTSDQGLVPI